MKCEKCNNNEANFHYRQTINGETTEYNLCSDCAGQEGLTSVFNWSPEQNQLDRMMGEFFGEPFMGFGRMLPGFGMMPRPAYAFPAMMTAVVPQIELEVEREDSEEKIPRDTQEEFNAKRELCALKHQLKAAVRSEEYEKAAELRDQIRAMEADKQ